MYFVMRACQHLQKVIFHLVNRDLIFNVSVISRINLYFKEFLLFSNRFSLCFVNLSRDCKPCSGGKYNLNEEDLPELKVHSSC